MWMQSTQKGKYVFACSTMLMQSTHNRILFAHNFLNNGLTFNMLALLELSQSIILYSNVEAVNANEGIYVFTIHLQCWCSPHKIEVYLPMTSLTMVQVSIHLHCWNCLSLFYHYLMLEFQTASWESRTLQFLGLVSAPLLLFSELLLLVTLLAISHPALDLLREQLQMMTLTRACLLLASVSVLTLEQCLDGKWWHWQGHVFCKHQCQCWHFERNTWFQMLCSDRVVLMLTLMFKNDPQFIPSINDAAADTWY